MAAQDNQATQHVFLHERGPPPLKVGPTRPLRPGKKQAPLELPTRDGRIKEAPAEPGPPTPAAPVQPAAG